MKKLLRWETREFLNMSKARTSIRSELLFFRQNRAIGEMARRPEGR